MADFSEIYEGMKILDEYESSEGSVSAGHDKFFVEGPSPDEIDERDGEELDSLGWIWHNRFGCWMHFT